jgi:ABC-type nitrate/sulfonate/bicarbonate transport system permease component
MASAAETSPARARLSLAPVLLPALSISAALALWELAPRLGLVRRTSVPVFSDVAREIGVTLQEPIFWRELQASSGRWALGFALAILIGVPLGMLMGRSRVLWQLVDPLLVVSYPVPKAALILIFVLWWGAGDLSRVVIIITGCLIPIVISSYHGASSVEPRLLWSARNLGTSRPRTLLKIILPAALPQILSGLRLAIAISIFTLLASELLIRQSGIGAYMFGMLDVGRNMRVWAVMVLLACIGFLLDFLYVRLVRLTLPWLEGEV